MSVNLFSEFPLAADFQRSVRDNRLKPQSTVKTVILYEEQNIALRNHRHDATRLNTGKTHGDVVLEIHLATQKNNAENINTERNYFHHRGADPTTVHRGADPAKIMSKMQKGSFYSISGGEACGISIIIIYYAILAWGYQFDRIYKIQKSYKSNHSK